MKPLYEVEVDRTNISPKSFFTYCAKAMKKHGGDIENWVEFDKWADETQQPFRNVWLHEDWEDPCKEIISGAPYQMQMFLSGAYNFILEFEFDSDKKGTGYFYAVEFPR